MSFEVNLSAKNFAVDDRLNHYVNKKIPKLDRKIKGIIDVRVDLSYVKSARDASDRNVAQITLRGKNFLLRAEERTDDIYSAFDSAMDKLQRRIERYKGKHYRDRGDGNSIRLSEIETAESESDQEYYSGEIVRRKKFELKPMNEMEAIEQMNLLGHEDFFLFFNVDTDSFNVLYRRRDNNYGLIETEIG
jgi:putative sigma-54 modulation protein